MGNQREKSLLVATDEPMAALGWTAAAAAWRLQTCACDLASLVTAAEGFAPDVLLLDAGAGLTVELLAHLRPHLGSAKLVIWVRQVALELALQVTALGVRGILRKNLPGNVQLRALDQVAAGDLWFEKSLSDSMLTAHRVTLTPREGQLATLVAQGCKNKEIAEELGISEGTVKVYLSRMFQKLRVNGRHELGIFALKNLASDPEWRADRGARVRSLSTLVIERCA